MDNAEWVQVDAEGNLFRAQYSADMGEPYSLLVRLSGDSFLAYSPGPGLIESALKIVNPDSRVYLLAPATGHTLGLVQWKSELGNSRVVASEITKARLIKKKLFTDVESLALLETKLPTNINVHLTPSSSFGEVWVSVESSGENRTYWAVCDSFMNLSTITGGFFLRFLMKMYGLKTGLVAHRVFKMGVKNKKEFREWALQRFTEDRNNILIPCHGEIYDGQDFTRRIRQIIEEQY